MEIKDYVRLVRRKLWIVVAIPVLATALGVAYLVSQPARYRGFATIVLPPPPPGGSISGATFQLVTNFREAQESEAVVEAVAESTGAPRSLVGGIEADQLGESTLIELSLVGEDPDEVRAVLESTVRESLALLREPTLSAAEQEYVQTRKDYMASIAAQDSFLDDSDLVNPPFEFGVESKRIDDLQLQREAAEARGDLEEVQALTERIDRRSSVLRTQLVRWRVLQDDRERTDSAHVSAYQAYIAAQAQFEAAQDPSVVNVTEPREVDPVQDMVRRLVPLVALAFVLAVGLVVLLEVIRPSRRAAMRSDERVDSLAG